MTVASAETVPTMPDNPWSLGPRVAIVGKYPFPEGVTAGMARISRDPAPIPELIAEAKDNAAASRKRNQRIIYDFGHSSVAEHAPFSLAIWGIPRSLSRQLLQHRVASYTQQSGRYIPFESLKAPFFLPVEYRANTRRSMFRRIREAHRRAYDAYARLFVGIRDHLCLGRDMPYGQAVRLATEDARYVLPLSHTTQIGLTANARELGLIAVRLLSGATTMAGLPEEIATGEALIERLRAVAPSVFPEKYVKAQAYPRAGFEAVRTVLQRHGAIAAWPLVAMYPPRDGDGGVPTWTAAVDLERTHGSELDLARLIARKHGAGVHWIAGRDHGHVGDTSEEAREVILASVAGIGSHDAVPRPFETIKYLFRFSVSETALHQVIRHRLGTMIDPIEGSIGHVGMVVPQSFSPLPAEMQDLALQTIHDLNSLADEVESDSGPERARIFRPHASRVVSTMEINARELIAFSRLRSDETAQWEVRSLSDRMVSAIGVIHPVIASIAGPRSERR